MIVGVGRVVGVRNRDECAYFVLVELEARPASESQTEAGPIKATAPKAAMPEAPVPEAVAAEVRVAKSGSSEASAPETSTDPVCMRLSSLLRLRVFRATGNASLGASVKGHDHGGNDRGRCPEAEEIATGEHDSLHACASCASQSCGPCRCSGHPAPRSCDGGVTLMSSPSPIRGRVPAAARRRGSRTFAAPRCR